MDSNTNDLLRNIGISAVSALPVCGSVLGYLLDKKIGIKYFQKKS